MYFSTELFITRLYAIILIFKTLHYNCLDYLDYTCLDYQVVDAALSFMPKMGASFASPWPQPKPSGAARTEVIESYFGLTTVAICICTSSIQFSAITQLYPNLCNPMDCSVPVSPVHHQLPEIDQTHVHPVGGAIQPSHLQSPSPTFNFSQHQGLFQ